MQNELNTNERLERLEVKVDRLDVKVDRLDEKVERLDERVNRLDEKVNRLDEKVNRLDEKVDLLETKVDQRSTELRTHFDVVAESWDGKFAMLYDFFRAYAEKTDERFADLKTLILSNSADLRASIKSSF